jgi:hypothetical protein
MQTLILPSGLWMMGSKQQILRHLAMLTRQYGPDITIPQLLQLLQQ